MSRQPPITRLGAIALLELSAPFDAADVRKAYLRALKKHKPEKDPEGFKQVRAAYELLLDAEVVAVDARELEHPGAEAHANASTLVPDGSPLTPAQSALEPWDEPLPEDPKEAAPLMRDWISRAQHDVTVPRPPMSSALAILFELLEIRTFKTAAGLHGAIDEHTTSAGVADGHRLAWVLAQGLWRLRKEIPEAVFSDMVRSAASGRVEHAADALAEFSRTEPQNAWRLRRRLQSRAPELAAIFGPFLPQPAVVAPETGSPTTFNRFMGVLAIGVLGLILVPTFQRCGYGKPRTAATATSAPPVAAAWELAFAASRRKHHDLATHANAVGDALTNGDCAAAHEELGHCRQLVNGLAYTDSYDYQTHWNTLAGHVRFRCPTTWGRPTASTSEGPPPTP